MNKTLVAGIAAGILVLGLILAPLDFDQFASAKHVKRMIQTKAFESMQDPGQGHETHQIAIILPPQDGVVYTGRFTYTASAPVEVVVLHDLKPGETAPKIYTIDGEKKWGLSLIFLGGEKKGASAGAMSFAGAALALHTLDGTKFTATVTVHAQARAMMGELPAPAPVKPIFNPTLNPRQISYPANEGFNDLYITAKRHLKPDGDPTKVEIIVHHHCKVYDDLTAACLLFPGGNGDQDKPYGIEYVISADKFAELPEEEKRLWHYHRHELPLVCAQTPDLTKDELEKLLPILNETYGKVVYFWKFGDKYPIGMPEVIIIEDLPKVQC